jgi:hypothetical protein
MIKEMFVEAGEKRSGGDEGGGGQPPRPRQLPT